MIKYRREDRLYTCCTGSMQKSKIIRKIIPVYLILRYNINVIIAHVNI